WNTHLPGTPRQPGLAHRPAAEQSAHPHQETPMRSQLLTTTLAALLLGGASMAQAQDNGFYAGVGAAQALVDERAYDDEDTAFSAFGGYQFHRNFALEAGYNDFGKLTPRTTGTAIGTDLELGSAYLAAVGILPFTEKFSGYAKAGFQRWDL